MRLSIITINYNNLSGLKKTMDSVFSQTCKDFEYIVIDGASTDGSAQLVKENADKIDYWASEKDTGIYNAMNKGVKVAKGEYVLMLNSGDYLVNENVIEKVFSLLCGADIVQGNVIEDCCGEVFRNRGYGKSDLSLFDVQHGRFLHQASFCKRSLFEQYGYFDESFRLNGDTVFFIKCLAFGNASFRYEDLDIANYDVSGLSSVRDGQWAEIHKFENERINSEIFSNRILSCCVENDKKVRLYDALHRHRWTWMLVMLIKNISDMIYPKEEIIKKEKVNDYYC